MIIKYTLFIFTLILLKERATSFIKHQWVNNGTYSYTVLRLNQISNGLQSFPLTAGASINTLKRKHPKFAVLILHKKALI